jgi:tRNA(fMet)-specific endonuclease VapC
VRLLDTDTCIEILRGNARVLERRSAVMDDTATTWINAAELFFGAARSASPERNRELVSSFLGTLPIVPFDRPAAEQFGQLKAGLLARGEGLADADLLIAAAALTHRAVLVTGNRRHVDRIDGLVVEDWIR